MALAGRVTARGAVYTENQVGRNVFLQKLVKRHRPIFSGSAV